MLLGSRSRGPGISARRCKPPGAVACITTGFADEAPVPAVGEPMDDEVVMAADRSPPDPLHASLPTRWRVCRRARLHPGILPRDAGVDPLSRRRTWSSSMMYRLSSGAWPASCFLRASEQREPGIQQAVVEQLGFGDEEIADPRQQVAVGTGQGKAHEYPPGRKCRSEADVDPMAGQPAVQVQQVGFRSARTRAQRRALLRARRTRPARHH